MLKRVPTHRYDCTTGYLYTVRTCDWPAPPIAGFYLHSERDRAGHEIAVFSKTPPYALRGTTHCSYPYTPRTHTCRFRFEASRRLHWMNDGKTDPPALLPRRGACRLRVRVPEDLAQWIYDHHTPQAWIRIALRAFAGCPLALAQIEDTAPLTYDARTMHSVAQHAGRYVASTHCKPWRVERTQAAQRGFYRSTGAETTQAARAYLYKHGTRSPIPLSASTTQAILALPAPARVLHTPRDRVMATLAVSLPAHERVPLQHAVTRYTNDSLDRWLAYLLMWVHAPTHQVPIRVAARLAAVLAGRPWHPLFHNHGRSTGVVDPYVLACVDDRDRRLWEDITQTQGYP